MPETPKDAWDILQERMEANPKPKLICRLTGHKEKHIEMGAGSGTVADWWECERCKVVL